MVPTILAIVLLVWLKGSHVSQVEKIIVEHKAPRWATKIAEVIIKSIFLAAGVIILFLWIILYFFVSG